jgi:hypothetical protein
LLVFKDFQEVRAGVLATARNASMQGVGTKLGTVESRDSGVMGQANIGISGQHGTYKTYKTPPCSVRRVSGVPPRLHHFAADKRRELGPQRLVERAVPPRRAQRGPNVRNGAAMAGTIERPARIAAVEHCATALNGAEADGSNVKGPRNDIAARQRAADEKRHFGCVCRLLPPLRRLFAVIQ